MTLRTLNYGNYGIFLIMDHAGFCPSKEEAGKQQQAAAGTSTQQQDAQHGISLSEQTASGCPRFRSRLRTETLDNFCK